MKHVLRLIGLTMVFMALSISLPQTIAAFAKVKISERTKYYSVSGRTGKQLFKSIVRRGPKLRQDGHAIATTTTVFKLRNLKAGVKRRRCVVNRADLIVKITYLYPRWRNSKRASKKVRRNWAKFYKSVQRHEATHGRNSRKYAKDLHARIHKATGRISRGCKNFGRSALRSIKRLERSFVRRDRRFDRSEGRANSRIRRLQKALLISK